MARQIEQTGKTISEAVETAVKKLGVELSDVEYKVLSEGSRGFLGLGAKPAKVLVTVTGEDEAEEILEEVKIEEVAEEVKEPRKFFKKETTVVEKATEEVTEEATTAAKNNTARNVMDADDGYIFPDADTSYVSKSSVKKLSDEELQYAVNEVYARHGLKFTKKKNKERFERKEWYVGTVDDQNDISLNKYEKKNVDTMAAELKKRGLR